MKTVALLLVAAACLPVSGSAQVTNNLVSVTCELANYADTSGEDGWRMIPANSKPTPIGGVVLKIVEPKTLAGQILTFHFDGPPTSDNRHFYEPGLMYQGQVRRDYVGSRAFMCDPGLTCTELTGPLPAQTPKELRRLLRDRRWNDEYAAAIKKQFGEKLLFRVLYGFLTKTDNSSTRFKDQRQAARLLVKFQPACDISLSVAMSETLGTWDESVGDWPLYLFRSFGQTRLLQSLAEMEKARLTETEREKIEIWRLSLPGDESDGSSVLRK